MENFEIFAKINSNINYLIIYYKISIYKHLKIIYKNIVIF